MQYVPQPGGCGGHSFEGRGLGFGPPAQEVPHGGETVPFLEVVAEGGPQDTVGEDLP